MKNRIFGKKKSQVGLTNSVNETIENENKLYNDNFVDQQYTNQQVYNEEIHTQNSNKYPYAANGIVNDNQRDSNDINNLDDSWTTKLKPKFSNGHIYVENKDVIPNYFNTNGNYLYNETLNKHNHDFETFLPKDSEKLLYNIRNLGADGTKFNKKYLNVTLQNINFDIYSNDRIAILSDLKNYDNLLFDLLKNKVKKNDGNIFAIKKKSSIWTDAHDGESTNLLDKSLNMNNLEDINYSVICNFKNTLTVILDKIISKFESTISNQIVMKLLEEFFLVDSRNESFNDLSEPEKNRFILLCDIIVKKRIIYAAYIGIDLNIRDKIHFFRFLSEYITNRDIVFFLITNDIIELKILCNKIIIIANRTIKEERYFKEILKYYESIDDYIILNIK